MLFRPDKTSSARSPAATLLVTCSILFVLSHTGLVLAQNPKPSPTPVVKTEAPEIDPDDVISVNTAEVLLPVTVRDNSGRLVEGLTKNDFRVFEDDVTDAQ